MPTPSTPARPVARQVNPAVWTWGGPYLAVALCAGAGRGLEATNGAGALGVMVAVLLAPAVVVAVAYRLGRPVAGVDRLQEVAYVAGCGTALAGWTAAAGFHAWPLAVVVVTVAVSGAVGWFVYGPGCRIPILAAGAGLGAGLLTLAVMNPFAHPHAVRWGLPWLLGTTAAALPYWLHCRSRRKVVVSIDLGPLLKAITEHVGKPVEVVERSLNTGPDGRYSIRLRLSGGKTAMAVQQVIPAVESELGLREGALIVAGQRARRDEVTVTVVPKVPRLQMQKQPPLPESITDPTPLGWHDTGDTMSVTLFDETGARGLLGGGEKGSGKSRGFWKLMVGWTHCPDVVLMMGDLSGGATSEPWMPCLYWRETTVEGARLQLKALLAVATARAAVLSERGWESWQPSPEHPAIVYALDEAQQLLKADWPARQDMEQLLQVDRKSGISVVTLCPIPAAYEGITPTMREQARTRLCWRSSGVASKWLLDGTPAAPVAYTVTEFTLPGQILGTGPGLAAVPGRCDDTNLATAKATAIAHAVRRPTLDALTEQAMRGVTGTALPGQPNAALPGPRVAPAETWTDRDEKAVYAMASVENAGDDTELKAKLTAMAMDPAGVLGHPWPNMPVPPQIPEGRLSTEQALRVAVAMIRQPRGTTPAALVAATRRSRSWCFGVLQQWVSEGVAIQPEQGRYTAAGQSENAPR